MFTAMSTSEIKLNRVTIKESDTGRDMIIMKAPEGWVNTVTTDRKSYRGSGQPFLVQAKSLSPDKQTALYYTSGLHYRDSHLEEYRDFSTDLYGNLYRKFMTVENFLKGYAERDLKDVKDRKFIRQVDWSDNAQAQEKLQKKRLEERKDPLTAIDWVYRKGALHEYAFLRNGYKRKRVYSAVIEGTEYAVWKEVPWTITQHINNPFMSDIVQRGLKLYRNARYDQNWGKWIYTESYYIDWTIRQNLVMDASEEDYEFFYKNVFLPVIAYGAGYADDLREDADKMQAARNARDRQKREEAERLRQQKRAKEKQQREEAEQKRQRDRRAREQLWQTQKEIEAIRRSSYENTQKSQAKVREMWSDTFRGDTRFVDKYGDEYVIHTYDNYAYKNGDTYVTSDSPLDHGWDWEELEKKKY